LDENDQAPATTSAHDRVSAALREAGIELPEAELAEIAEATQALQRLLDIVRAGRPLP
jgi:hypothetical protein